MEKVNEYKERKARKQENKKKWELINKSQKMLWKKNTTNYNKWEFLTSSSEEEDLEPIVPKNDPAFKALEKDMEDRRKKKE